MVAKAKIGDKNRPVVTNKVTTAVLSKINQTGTKCKVIQNANNLALIFIYRNDFNRSFSPEDSKPNFHRNRDKYVLQLS